MQLKRFSGGFPNLSLKLASICLACCSNRFACAGFLFPKEILHVCVSFDYINDFEDFAAKSKSKCFLVFSHSKGFGAGHLSNCTLGRSTVGLQSVLPNLPPKLPHSWVGQKYLYAKNPF